MFTLALAGGLLAPALFVAQPAPPTSTLPPPPDPAAPAPFSRPTSGISTMGRADSVSSDALGALGPGEGVAPFGTLPGVSFLRGLHPYVMYRAQHARGIPNGPGERYSSTVHEVGAGVVWNIGEHWSLGYSPMWTYYTNDALDDTVDHNFTADWRTTYQNWAFNLSHRTASSHSVIIETGEQTERRQFQTMLGAAVELNSRLTWEHRLRHNVRLSERFANFREYSLEERIARTFGERLTASIGALYGYVDVDDGANHQHVSPRLNVDWQVGEKLTLSGYTGVEHRWFSEGIGDMTNPIFDVSAQYAFLENTSLYVGYNRSVSPSFFQDTVTRREVIDATISQRLLGRFFLSASVARRTSRYESPSGGSIDGRRDRQLRYSFRLSTALGERGAISLFYQPEAENDSNRTDFSYDVRTYGGQINYQS